MPGFKYLKRFVITITPKYRISSFFVFFSRKKAFFRHTAHPALDPKREKAVPNP
jgi:hypothetical protein